MRTRARPARPGPKQPGIEEEIAALAVEVRELMRQRGGVLPEVKEWVELILALVGESRAAAEPLAMAFDTIGVAALTDHVQALSIVPGDEAVREGLLRALDAAARADLHAYRGAVKALRPVLDELRTVRDAKWNEELTRAFHFIRNYHAPAWPASPERKRPASLPARTRCGDVLVIAGLVLRSSQSAMLPGAQETANPVLQAVPYPSTWVKTVTNGANKTVTYQYNGVGDVSTMTTPGSLDFSYSYNARNQVSSITAPNSVTISFTYDNGGRRKRVDRPGGYTLYTYNARDWVTYVYNRDSSGADKYKVHPAWDQAGNVTQKSEWFDGVAGYYWTYYSLDGVYRLTREARKYSSSSTYDYDYRYTYDAVGNRATEQELVAGWTRYYTYDDNDKLTKMGTTSGGNNLATFGYDSNGNMTSVAGSLYGSKPLVYNDEDRLTSIAYGGVTDLYYYTWQGLRYSARLNGTYWRYVYNGDRVLEETDDSNGTLVRYTTVGGSYYQPLLHFKRNDGSIRYPLADMVGTARRLVDQNGAATDAYSLDAFGRGTTAWGTTPNPYRYGAAWGYITDTPGSGLLQLGARFYWPEIGRFIQQDPIGAGMNWYAYAGNNPVTWVDPEGLFFSWEDPARPSGAVRTLQKANNFSAGLGDTVTLGMTRRLRQSDGTDYLIDPCSGWYKGGQWTGRGLIAATGAAGTVRVISARLAARAAVEVAAEAATEGGASTLAEVTDGVATALKDHALTRMAERSVSLADIVDAVNNPVVIKDWVITNGRWSAQYIGKTAVVVLNEMGEVVTVWSRISR